MNPLFLICALALPPQNPISRANEIRDILVKEKGYDEFYVTMGMTMRAPHKKSWKLIYKDPKGEFRVWARRLKSGT
jgi:hypothetical protein